MKTRGDQIRIVGFAVTLLGSLVLPKAVVAEHLFPITNFGAFAVESMGSGENCFVTNHHNKSKARHEGSGTFSLSVSPPFEEDLSIRFKLSVRENELLMQTEEIDALEAGLFQNGKLVWLAKPTFKERYLDKWPVYRMTASDISKVLADMPNADTVEISTEGGLVMFSEAFDAEVARNGLRYCINYFTHSDVTPRWDSWPLDANEFRGANALGRERRTK
ncbi:MAG: hypothetical protein HRU31_04985 [Rhodobacteraceae bacterium]|nr:hypothetical protein [Paracoccaceae bacterium]